MREFSSKLPAGYMECLQCAGYGHVEETDYYLQDEGTIPVCCRNCEGTGCVEILEILAND